MNGENDGRGQNHVNEGGYGARNGRLDAVVEQALDVIGMKVHAGHEPFGARMVVEPIAKRRIGVGGGPRGAIAADEDDAMVELREGRLVSAVNVERRYVGKV